MYLLDTNVVSELRRPRPNGAVLAWIADVPAEQLFLSAVTVGEIQAGSVILGRVILTGISSLLGLATVQDMVYNSIVWTLAASASA